MIYDAIIIGFGKAGKTLAGYLGKKGKQVALIEKDEKMYGGTCINVGCIPSKSLVNSSELSFRCNYHTFKEKEFAYEKAIEEKERVTTFLRGKNYNKLASNTNIKIFDGEASFVDSHHVNIAFLNGKTKVIEGRDIFINTGSTSFIPPIEGIKDNPFIFYSDTLMNLKKLPKKLIIIGGGYIGLEFASMYCNFGSEVTILQMEPIFVPREEREIASSIEESFINRGISIVYSAQIKKIESDTVIYRINEEEHKISGDAILVATGRKPNVSRLKVENAGIILSPRGAIAVNEHLQTNVENIYALGDCNGGLQFTYISLDDFRIIKSNYENGDYSLSKRKNVPYSVFITPSLSRIGYIEQELIDKKINYKVFSLPVAAIPKAQVLKNTSGIARILVDLDTHYILGASLFMPESYEIINIIKVAMDNNIKYEYLRDNIFTHPTMSEALNDILQ